MQLTPSKGTTRAVKLLAKGRQYLQPKPEAKESDESVSEQSGSNDESQPTSSSGTTEDSSKDSSTSSSDRFTPGSDDADTDDEDVSSEYPSEDEPLEQARSKKKKSGPSVGKTKEVVWMQRASVRLVKVLTSKLRRQRIPKKWKIRK